MYMVFQLSLVQLKGSELHTPHKQEWRNRPFFFLIMDDAIKNVVCNHNEIEYIGSVL